MIEKLNLEEVDNPGEATLKAFSILNQLVDAVNELHEEAQNNARKRAIHEKQIDELQMKVDVLFSRFDMISLALEKKNARPHKEQQDWLGHIVEYGNADDGFKYGILTNIDDTFSAFPYEIDNGRDATADCWLPDDSLFYKREEK